MVLGALVVMLMLVAGGAIYVATTEEPLPPKPDIPLDAWVPYWTLDDVLPETDRRFDAVREASPFWYAARGVDRIVISRENSRASS